MVIAKNKINNGSNQRHVCSFDPAALPPSFHHHHLHRHPAVEMADVTDKKVDVEHLSSNEDKSHHKHHKDVSGVANLDSARSRGLQPPDIIARLSPEDRVFLEKKLRKKIDLRLLPMVILMYIMNYIDRLVNSFIFTIAYTTRRWRCSFILYIFSSFWTLTDMKEQHRSCETGWFA